MEMIRLKHMTKRFQEHVIFKDFSYTFEKGKFYAITGESGSGKSTLLHVIGALDPIDEGDILLAQRYSVRDKRHHRMLWKV